MEQIASLFSASGAGEAAGSSIYSSISTGASVLSGVNQIVGGRQQDELYQAQAVQARLQSRGEAVKYEQQANLIARRALEAQAMARARAAAGGIDPFSGSAQFIQDISAKDAGEEMDLLKDNATLARLAGEQQAEAYRRAGRTARTRGLLSGLATAGVGFAKASKIGGPPSSTSTRRQNSSLNVYGVPAYG